MDPKKARKIAKVIALIVALAMLVTSFSFVMMIPGVFGRDGSVVYAAAASEEDLDLEIEKLKEYIEFIQGNYKDEIALKDLVQGAFAGVADSLGDPYSIYYGASGAGENFIESVSGEYSGIGLSLESYNGQCRVVAPTAGTPAEKSGIKPGDIVTKVDGTDISAKTLDEAAAMMRGEAGTKVTLTVNRGGQVLTFTLTREKIKNISVNYKLLGDKIGHIQITSFDSDTNVEFRLAKTELMNKGAASLILDLRNNPGGLVNTAVDIADQLMPKGPITHFEQKGKVMETYSAEGVTVPSPPIVLLVNEGSASASEILAGALQDSKTATLVGTTTFGKGVAQQVAEFPDGTSLKLSTYYFLTPNKKKIDHVGITPDYTVRNGSNAGEKELAEQYAAFAPMKEKVKPRAGDTGLNVYGAQQRLAMLGYSVVVNGTMDETTVAAVRKLQQESGLSPYGVLDYTTMETLDKAVVQFILGMSAGEDPQLAKAIELLK